jgi:hypothetical protein
MKQLESRVQLYLSYKEHNARGLQLSEPLGAQSQGFTITLATGSTKLSNDFECLWFLLSTDSNS